MLDEGVCLKPRSCSLVHDSTSASMQVLVKTWAGILIQASGSEANKRKSEVEQKRGKHFRNKISVLPPLKSLPPPISLSDPVSSNIDLRVNFETEIKPFLGQCLVSFSQIICCRLASIAHRNQSWLENLCLYVLPSCEDYIAQHAEASCKQACNETADIQLLPHARYIATALQINLRKDCRLLAGQWRVRFSL